MSNEVWHVALKPGTTEMQDVILADVDPNDLETIETLLSTSILVSHVIKTERDSYLLISDGECERPYPSVMIWRVEISGEERTVVDMRQKDGWIIKYVWREWLMPEETDAEYVPPSQFLVMMKRQSLHP